MEPKILPPLEEDQTSPHEDNVSANGEIIDFNTMKYWPTDMTHIAVRKTLLAAGITTKTQLLEFLGTTAPTRIDWEVFIKKLTKIAKQAGFKFYASSDGTLYWWLTKKMKWVQPFSSNQ